MPKKFFLINLFNQGNCPIYCGHPSKSVCGKFFVLKLHWELAFVLKFTVSTFIIVSPKTKLGFRAPTVLFPTLIRFCKIYRIFGIVIKRFVNVINFVRILLFKSLSFFH